MLLLVNLWFFGTESKVLVGNKREEEDAEAYRFVLLFSGLSASWKSETRFFFFVFNSPECTKNPPYSFSTSSVCLSTYSNKVNIVARCKVYILKNKV